jgi:serine/threonine-protein kinase
MARAMGMRSMSSDAAGWEQLQDLFHLIDAAPAADRERLLLAACDDAEMRDRVWAIHRASVGAEAASAAPAVSAAPPARFIGPYRLGRHLGSGGMGSVYAAERLLDGTIQRSAVKVLAPHAAGPELAERFQRERHILASLDHPAITRMLDAGIDAEGRGYLSMEFVDGTHLDAYCNAGTLGIPERLHLFLKVCEAVDYAHRNLVVHLDLKPSNILVTASGVVKLLDFGTAKLIDTSGTTTHTITATPAYASPEQLRGEAVTTACDIYALGAILFELLSGRKPFGESSVAVGIERAVSLREPPAVSDAVSPEAASARGMSEARLRGLLTGDLSTIVRHCLAAQPRDRYASVNALAQDIDRYLGSRPILARPQTTWYHLQKFVRRNRFAVLASVIVCVALVTSLLVAWRGEQRALREGQRALLMQTFLYRLFEIANSNYTGKPAASIKDFLALGVKTLPEYVHDPGDLRQAQLALAKSMYWNHDYGDAKPIYASIATGAEAAGDVAAQAEADAYLGYLALREGATDEAKARSARALELSADPKVSPDVGVLSRLNYALVREQTGWHSKDNVRILAEAVDIAKQHHLPAHRIGELLYFWGSVVLGNGSIDEAEKLYQEALRTYQLDPLSVCDEISVEAGLANVANYRNDLGASTRLYDEAYERSKTCNGPDDTQTLRFLMSYANSLVKTGRAAEALPLLEGAMPVWRSKIKESSPYTTELLQPLGRAYVETGNYARAEQVAHEMQGALEQAKFAPAHKYWGYAHFMLAQALAGQGRVSEALPEAQAAFGNLSAFATTPSGILNSERARALLEDLRQRTARAASGAD